MQENIENENEANDARENTTVTPDAAPAPQPAKIAEEKIEVGAGGTLVVPREDIGADIEAGTELDTAELMAPKIRKPQRREWVVLNRRAELTTRLLLHKPRLQGLDTQHFFVEHKLRSRIADELKPVRVFPYYSLTAKTKALWVVSVTEGNEWYNSLAALLHQPPEFFDTNAIRILSDKEQGKYRIRHKAFDGTVTWSPKSTDVLLGEALGPDSFIRSPDHPIYADLIAGVELT